MWICPVCEKKNIDNAAVCLHCGKSRVCPFCENPSFGETCTFCGGNLHEEVWLCENEYSKLLNEENKKADAPDNQVAGATVESQETVNEQEPESVIEPDKQDLNNEEEKKPAKKESVKDNKEKKDKKDKKDKKKKKETVAVVEPKKEKKPAKADKKDKNSAKQSGNKKKHEALWIIAAILLIGIIVFSLYYFIYRPAYKSVGSSPEDRAVVSDGNNFQDVKADLDLPEQPVAGSDGETPVNSDAEAQTASDETQPPKKDTREENYENAVAAYNSGNLSGAYVAFKSLGAYRDSASYLGSIAYGATDFLSAGYNHTVGLKKDGTVVATGNNDHGKAEVSSWSSVRDVTARGLHTVGIKVDGTLVATGSNADGQCNVSHLSGITDVKAGAKHTLARTQNGTAVAVGNNEYGQCDVSAWSDIKEISSGAYHSVALKNDGTVVAVGNNKYGQCDVSGWTGIVHVTAGDWYTVGLKADGTVVSAGNNYYGQRNLSGWKNIAYVYAGLSHTVGIKTDGTVVAAGSNKFGECNVSGWKNVMTVCAGYRYTVALLSDGTVISVGDNSQGQCTVAAWQSIAL